MSMSMASPLVPAVGATSATRRVWARRGVIDVDYERSLHRHTHIGEYQVEEWGQIFLNRISRAKFLPRYLGWACAS